MEEINDMEVLAIMADGGRKLCDYAIGKWWQDEYKMGHEENVKNIRRWKEIKARISDLRVTFKHGLENKK